MDALQVDINLSFQQILSAVKQLSPADKIKLNEFIWSQDCEIPIEHQTLVLDRIKKSTSSTLLNWDEAAKTLIP